MSRIIIMLIVAASLSAADPELVFDVTLIDKQGKNPLIVAWLEDDRGKFIRTMHVFGKAKKHFKDLTTWWSKRGSKEDQKTLDAVVGATVFWKQHVVVKTPATGIPLGSVLRIEQGQESKPDYDTAKISILLDARWKGTVLKANEFFEQLSVTLSPSPADAVTAAKKGKTTTPSPPLNQP